MKQPASMACFWKSIVYEGKQGKRQGLNTGKTNNFIRKGNNHDNIRN